MFLDNKVNFCAEKKVKVSNKYKENHMPAINPISFQASRPIQKLSFRAEAQQGSKEDAVLKDMDKTYGSTFQKGSKLKKVVGIAAIVAILGSIVLHKMPADKIPGALKPIKDMVGGLISSITGIFSKKGAPEAGNVVKEVIEKAAT